jgi:hypothetical protein
VEVKDVGLPGETLDCQRESEIGVVGPALQRKIDPSHARTGKPAPEEPSSWPSDGHFVAELGAETRKIPNDDRRSALCGLGDMQDAESGQVPGELAPLWCHKPLNECRWPPNRLLYSRIVHLQRLMIYKCYNSWYDRTGRAASYRAG